MIGQTISHYKITAKLGEGGMGEVYLATDTTLDRSVALKFLPSSLQKDPEARERLIREAKAASRLNHKNILTIHSVEHAEDGDFIVMEFVEGRSLKEILESGEALPIDQVLRLALQICDGLSAAHEHGVIHRDIKPANILVTPKGQVKITDFGLATWRGARQLTKEGSTVGTAGYMSPEQVQGKATDQRSDVFSAGVVLYELIARRLPFSGEHDAAIAYSILNETPEPLARFKSNLPVGIQEIVARALEKDPSMRYQSAADMLADLKRARRDSDGSRPSAVMSATHPVRPKRSYLKYLVATSVVFVAALVILILKPFKFEVTNDQKAAASENSLAVMYFDNLVDSDDRDKTATMVTSLLITGLSESEYLQVVSRQRLYDILGQLGQEGATKIDRSTASKVAEKAGVKMIVTGDILQIQPKIVLSAEVSDAASGKLVTNQRISGEPGEDLFTVVDRLSAAIRSHLSLPEPASTEAPRPVADVTTHSPEAYRAYLEGLDFNYKFYGTEARKSLEKALSYDSTFAMAYYHLATLNTGDAPGVLGREWSAKAKKYADKASWKEQRYIAALNEDDAGKPEAALAELNQIVTRYPDEKDAFTMMGNIYGRINRTEEGIAVLQKVIAIDPSYKLAYNQLAYFYDRVGDFEKSLESINRYIALAPDEANPYDSRAELYAFNGRLDESIDSYRKALQIKPDFTPSRLKLGGMYIFKGDMGRADSVFKAMASSTDRDVRSEGRMALAFVPAFQGRFTEALKLLDEGITADRLEEYEGQWSIAKVESKVTMYEAQGDFARALTTLRTQQPKTKALFPNDIVNYRDWEAQLLVEGGDTVAARKVAEDMRREIEKSDSSLIRIYWYAAAQIAAAEGNDDEVIADLAKMPASFHMFGAGYLLAQSWLRKGALDKAVATLEKTMSYYDNTQGNEPYKCVMAHYLLGQAYEQSGWKDKAVQQYQTFLDIWKNADPGIKELDDARARIAKLRV